MNEKDAWENFISSGSVADYLKYASIKNSHAAAEVQNNEVQYGRSCDSGTEYKGTGQINNSLNKK